MSKNDFFLRHRYFALCLLVAIEGWNTASFLMMPSSIIRLINILAIPAGVCTISWYALGHPRNWWRQYFGTYVEFSMSDRADEYETDEEVDAAVSEWLRLSGIKTYYRVGTYYYQFLRKKDAVQFKLAWG